MSEKKRVSFTLAEDDFVDAGLRWNFSGAAKSYGIPIGKLLSRAFYLALTELYERELSPESEEDFGLFPTDPSKPRITEVFVNPETWRKAADASWLRKFDRELEESRQRELERQKKQLENAPPKDERAP